MVFRVVHPGPVTITEAGVALRLGRSAEVARTVTALAGTLAAYPKEVIPLAWKLADAGEISAAETLLRTTWEANPTNADGVEALVNFYLGQQRVADARRVLEDYERAANRPLSAALLRKKAEFLVAEGRFSEATQLLTRLARTSPPDYSTLVQLGDLLSWQQQFRPAIALYRQARTLEPGDWKLDLNLARALSWAAMTDARVALEKARSSAR